MVSVFRKWGRMLCRDRLYKSRPVGPELLKSSFVLVRLKTFRSSTQMKSALKAWTPSGHTCRRFPRSLLPLKCCRCYDAGVCYVLCFLTGEPWCNNYISSEGHAVVHITTRFCQKFSETLQSSEPFLLCVNKHKDSPDVLLASGRWRLTVTVRRARINTRAADPSMWSVRWILQTPLWESFTEVTNNVNTE